MGRAKNIVEGAMNIVDGAKNLVIEVEECKKQVLDREEDKEDIQKLENRIGGDVVLDSQVLVVVEKGNGKHDDDDSYDKKQYPSIANIDVHDLQAGLTNEIGHVQLAGAEQEGAGGVVCGGNNCIADVLNTMVFKKGISISNNLVHNGIAGNIVKAMIKINFEEKMRLKSMDFIENWTSKLHIKDAPVINIDAEVVLVTMHLHHILLQ